MKSVLIVDDANFIRKMIGDILRRNGLDVIGEAINGKEAFDKYKELRPDIVTMDLTMPYVDGITAIEDIISLDSEAKIIVCSVMAQEDKVTRALMAGAKDFVIKPIKEDRLISAIANILCNEDE